MSSHRTRQAAALCVAAAMTAALAACGGSDSSSPSPTTAVTAPGAASPTPPLTSAGVDSATAEQVKTVYLKFVDPAVPEGQKAGLLENGDSFAAAIHDQASSDFAATASVTVSKVAADPADGNRAVVTFSLLISGSPILANHTGYAVKQDGAWKVADATFCSLLAIRGVTPPGCAAASSAAG